MVDELASFEGDQTTEVVSVSPVLPPVLLLFLQGCPHFFSCSTRSLRQCPANTSYNNNNNNSINYMVKVVANTLPVLLTWKLLMLYPVPTYANSGTGATPFYVGDE